MVFIALRTVVGLGMKHPLFVGLGYAFGLGIERLYDRIPAFHQWLPYLLIPVGVGLLWKVWVRARRW